MFKDPQAYLIPIPSHFELPRSNLKFTQPRTLRYPSFPMTHDPRAIPSVSMHSDNRSNGEVAVDLAFGPPTAFLSQVTQHLARNALYVQTPNSKIMPMPNQPAMEDFSLDMISADMDFEAAYSMFNGLQAQHAQSEVERLQKQQALFRASPPPPPSMPPSGLAEPEMYTHHFPGNTDYDLKQLFEKSVYEQHRQQILRGLEPTPGPNFLLDLNHPGSGYENLLSVTESSAIEHFLDTLDGDMGNFLQPRHVSQPNLGSVHGSTLLESGPNPLDHGRAPSIHDQINKAFEYGNEYREQARVSPSTKALLSKPHRVTKPSHGQTFEPIYPTYTAGEQFGLPQETFGGESLALDLAPKKKRIPRKTLLTLEQKRLNHTSSEQRRRQLIKDAFDGLVTTINESRVGNAITAPASGSEIELKRKAKQPSKFMVLTHVLKEMQMLESINAELRAML